MTLTSEQKVQLAECYEQYGRILNQVIENKQFGYAKLVLRSSPDHEFTVLNRGKSQGLTELYQLLEKCHAENKKIEEVSHAN